MEAARLLRRDPQVNCQPRSLQFTVGQCLPSKYASTHDQIGTNAQSSAPGRVGLRFLLPKRTRELFVWSHSSNFPLRMSCCGPSLNPSLAARARWKPTTGNPILRTASSMERPPGRHKLFLWRVILIFSLTKPSSPLTSLNPVTKFSVCPPFAQDASN